MITFASLWGAFACTERLVPEFTSIAVLGFTFATARLSVPILAGIAAGIGLNADAFAEFVV